MCKVVIIPAAAVLPAAGIGLYAHITSRNRRRSGAKHVPSAKEAGADAGQAAAKSSSNQLPSPVAQTQQPLGGLFEPIGCPCLGTPSGHEPRHFIQSITSSKSNSSRSKMSCSLRPYPAAAVPATVSLRADSVSCGLESQHAQQRSHVPVSSLTMPAGRSTAAAPSNPTQHAVSNAQHAQQAADDTLSEEAAAAEAVLDSFSRASSHDALQSHCRVGSVTSTAAIPPPVEDTAAARQEAVTQSANAPTAIDKPYAVGPQPAGQKAATVWLTGASGQQQQQKHIIEAPAGKGRFGAFGSAKPQQGYPGQGAGPAGQPFGRAGQSLSNAQVN